MIPKIVQQIWLGGMEGCPKEFVTWREGAILLNPGWRFELRTEDSRVDEARARKGMHGGLTEGQWLRTLTNVVRFELACEAIERGESFFYMDMDVEVKAPLDRLTLTPGKISCDVLSQRPQYGIFACEPGNKTVFAIRDLFRELWGRKTTTFMHHWWKYWKMHRDEFATIPEVMGERSKICPPTDPILHHWFSSGNRQGPYVIGGQWCG